MSAPNRIAVIMAGGSGERFWPLSRAARPKQLLRLTDPEQTLLQEAVGRIRPMIAPERIFVITSRRLEGPIRESNIGIPPENVIGEPAKRNTAGCLCYAAATALARFSPAEAAETSMAVLTADHRIDDPAGFRATVEAALHAAETTGALVTIGVPPTRPETGYGYIEIAESAPEGAAAGSAARASWAPAAEPTQGAPTLSGLPPVFPVASFREKPDAPTAREFLATGRFLWNSGMFFWRLGSFLDELTAARAPLAIAARAMAGPLRIGDQSSADAIFGALEDISIDYALLERARRVMVARAAFGWDDVGAWDALDRTFPADAAGNVALGDPVLIGARDCIVYNEPGAQRMAVSVVGVEGLVVVVSADGVLVIPKNRAQEVKQAVAELKARGAAQL